MRALSRAAFAAAWLAAGCLDEGAVGTVAPKLTCEPACAADEICDPMLNRCMECVGAECGEPPDECDDCPAGDTACQQMLCRPCLTNADCFRDEPICRDGFCAELEDDDF